MALNEARNWLIAYDVADPQRLRRVHGFLKTVAVPVQYSVFVTRATPMKAGQIRAGLSAIINHREDDVRIYPVPEPADLHVFGRSTMPEGLHLMDGRTGLTLVPFSVSEKNAPAYHPPNGMTAGQACAGNQRCSEPKVWQP